jgi:hypothetical protein
MESKRDKLMLREAKKVIKSIKSQDITGIASALICNGFYFNNSEYFYKFFGAQGGTIWQLARNISEYNRNANAEAVL